MNRRIIDYKSSNSYDAYDLDSKIVKAIGRGWQPFGGISSFVCDGRSVWAQAMVKYEPEHDSTGFYSDKEINEMLDVADDITIPDKPPF
jgi:hypothetical protein